MTEIIYEGLVGPTYTFSGLARGNLAAGAHRGEPSNPKQAALQSLAKMRQMASLGLHVAVLPPHERPLLTMLQRLGYNSLQEASPPLLQACSSASAAWAANSAHITASSDTLDGLLRITPANLASQFHRSLEVETTSWLMMAMLPHAEHLDPLPSHPNFGDEGQGNSLRLSGEAGEAGITLRVYGRKAYRPGPAPSRFPARQTAEACEALDRLHRIRDGHTLHAQLSPELIDQGIFHNDLVATGHGNLLLHYEGCWVDTDRTVSELRHRMQLLCHTELEVVEIGRNELPIESLLGSYLLNSQIFSARGERIWLLPEITDDAAQRVVDRLSKHFDQVVMVDLSESLKNGGGPGCTSLRAPLTQEEFDAAHQLPLMNPELHQELEKLIHEFYRDRLTPDDLADPALLLEGQQFLDHLTEMLDLGPLYPFQQG